MPTLEEDAGLDVPETLDFSVTSQRVDLDFDFANKVVSGSTQIVAQPLSKQSKVFRLNCRQCRILRVTVEGKPAVINYTDPYDKLRTRKGGSNVHHHDFLKSKIAPHVQELPECELKIALPPRVSIKELDNDGGYTAVRPTMKRKESESGPPDTPGLQEIEGPRFAPLKIYIEFRLDKFRDGLHWVGLGPDDGRYPHVYTRNTLAPGSISSVFPCVDNPNSRCTWEVSITCPKTLGDAFKTNAKGDQTINGQEVATGSRPANRSSTVKLTAEEKALELQVVCSGEIVDDIVDAVDLGRRTVSFSCPTPVAARHVGFAIGPFELVELSSEFRQADEDDKLGQSAVKLLGYCLPGRSDELRNTCWPITRAIDFFTVNYGSFPFANYKMCFVDDLIHETADLAGLTLCSNRLLFTEDVIDKLDPHTRTLVLGLARQYSGVNVIPKESTDLWAVAGMAGFMADMFMKKLSGNNEYRFRQKMAADQVFEQDVDRYSLHQLGGQLDIDPSEFEFLQLKAAVVLFILDRRLTKQSGSTGMSRIITRIFLNVKTGDLTNGEITTEHFLRTCERLGHAKLDSFFKQWVYNAGCPDFMVTQKFNKKKLVVEMSIQQMQSTRPRRLNLQPSTFLREAKEQVSEAYAPEVQPAFVGPMTIRIHEADGTPYEHIVEIKDVTTRFEIPYNTKYKRLKRSRKAKERSIAINGPEQVGDSQDDVLLYCLGDTLQSEQEVKDWYLVDWTEQQENQMGQESYEWIRMDADFEWIGRINLNMPIYMYVSQLQQDRDIVAQYESVQRIAQQEPHPMGSTILIRTLMDRRYFHGIRTAAAVGLTKLAVPSLRYLGLYHLDKAFSELYCFADQPTMPRPNDFSDRASYLVQCTIPRVMTMVRDPEGRIPIQVRKFLSDKIRFNDNSQNENSYNLSDAFYLATLTECLIEAVASLKRAPKKFDFSFDDDEMPVDTEDDVFRSEALGELERYRNSDEWTPSFQNVTTITAITCIERLIERGGQTNRGADILAYSRPDNAENVRLRAFQSLVHLGFIRRPPIMRYLLDTMAGDESPYIRFQLARIFGQALGVIAIADEDQVKDPGTVMDIDSGLVVEGDASADNRQQELARKSSPEGATQALRLQLENDQVFKASLWDAAVSERLSLTETNGMLEVAALLFEPSSMQGSLVITLPLPKQWKARHLGQGKLRFYKDKAVRTKPSKYRPMSAKDFELVKKHGLVYNGPKSKQLQEADLAAQIAAVQKELERQQTLHQGIKVNTSSQMSPPPMPVAAETSTGGGLKLSLKRKPSMDITRAPSPKQPKTSKNQLAGGSVPSTPIVLAKPRPSPKPAVGGTIVLSSKKAEAKAKAKSRIVKLKFPTKADRLRDIVGGRHPRAGGTGHTDPPQPGDGYFPKMESPSSASGAFPSSCEPKPPGWNVGGFRNFSVSSSPAPIKTELNDESTITVAHPLPPSSPDDMPLALAQQRRDPSIKTETKQNGSGEETNAKAMQEEVARPAPVRKITLKFGKKAAPAQSPM